MAWRWHGGCQPSTPVSIRPWLLALSLAPALSAQGLELAERVPAPLVHLSVEQTEDDGNADPWDWLGDLRTLAGDDETLASLVSVLSATAWEKIELAWTGTLPRRGDSHLPLMVFRARMSQASVDRVAEVLRGAAQFQRKRKLAEHQIYAMGGSGLEFALVGSDVVVSNHGGSLDDLLDPRTSRDRALERDEVYRAMRAKLGTTGTLVLYADLARIRDHAPELLAEQLPALGGSGLSSMRRLMLASRAEGDSVRTSVALESDRVPEGWLGLVERMPIDELAKRLPVAGLGGLALALPPARLLAARAARPADGRRAMHVDLAGISGMEPESRRELLDGMGDACAIEFYDVGERGRPLPQAVWSLDVSGKSSAKRAFDRCVDAMTPSSAAELRSVGRSRELVVKSPTGDVHVAAVGDSLSVGFHDLAIERALGATAGLSGRKRQRLVRDAESVLGELGLDEGDEVAGLLRLDLSPLAGAAGKGRSPLLRQHVGYLEVTGGSVRLEVVTQD